MKDKGCAVGKRGKRANALLKKGKKRFRMRGSGGTRVG